MSRPAVQDGAIPGYFPALDGLRFFCASAVIVAHSFHDPRIPTGAGHPYQTFLVSLGATGVNVFFALSGFLITKLLLDEVVANGCVDLKYFYIRRTLRIWPVYYVALLIGFGLTFIMGEWFTRPLAYTSAPELWTTAFPAFLLFLGNWTEAAVPTSLIVLWSVCVEEQFYILFPPTFAWSKRRYPALIPIIGGLALAWSVRFYLTYQGRPDHIYFNTFAHGDHLILGAALAQLLHAAPGRLLRSIRRAGAMGEFAAVTACLGFTLFHDTHYFVSAVVSTSAVATIGLGGGPISRWLARPTLRWLGGLTYAAYVFHPYGVVLAWAICRRIIFDPPWLGALLRAAVAIPLTFAIAYASKVFLEQRFMSLKKLFHPVTGSPVSQRQSISSRAGLGPGVLDP